MGSRIIILIFVLNLEFLLSVAQRVNDLGGPCDTNADCAVEHSECVSVGGGKSCQCVFGYIANSVMTRCLEIQNSINDPCEEPPQCQKGHLGPLSDCVRSGCQCSSDAVKDPLIQECLPKAMAVGNPCLRNVQCTENLGAGSSCVTTPTGGVCRCDSFHVPRDDLSECLPIVDNLDDDCEESRQCQMGIPHSDCIGRLCKCKLGTILWNGRCLEQKGYGESCDENIQCVERLGSLAECGGGGLLKMCLCNRDAELSSDRTKCVCPDRFVESLKNPGTCINIVSELYLPCIEPVQCSSGLGNLTNCYHSRCQCEFQYAHWNGGCHIPVPLGGACMYNEECYVGSNNITVCFGGRCRCLETASPFNGKCWVNKQLGDNCHSDEECRYSIRGEVICGRSSYECTCQSGWSAYESMECTQTWPDKGSVIRASHTYLILTIPSLLFVQL